MKLYSSVHSVCPLSPALQMPLSHLVGENKFLLTLICVSQSQPIVKRTVNRRELRRALGSPWTLLSLTFRHLPLSS